MVDAAVDAFRRGQTERAAAPTVVALRAHFEAVRRDVLAAASAADAAAATRLLINRLLHHPSAWLRRGGGDPAVDATVRRLFRLDGGEDEENQG
jgi:glutamyl-tRNA reductase